jgi:hypothetical protein
MVSSLARCERWRGFHDMRLDVSFIIFSTRNGHEKKKVGIKIKHVLKRKVFDAL